MESKVLGTDDEEQEKKPVVTEDFFKFPHTPQLAWFAAGRPREDKVLDEATRTDFLTREIVVEEKVDGANIGFSVGQDGRLRVQNRGSYLGPASHPQFGPLWPWIAVRESAMVAILGPDLMLFGEWCFAVHSVEYDRLPDWFQGFDVYERRSGRFWSSARRNSLLEKLGIATVPSVARGLFDLDRLRRLLDEPTQIGSGPREGIYLRRDEGDWTVDRAKLVRPEFADAIEEHWSRKQLKKNRLAEKWVATPAVTFASST